jgi:hypothetical protein
MLDFSLRHLNFLLNEIHKGEIIGIVFILRKSPSSKKYLPDAQERFYFFCNNKDNDIKTRGSVVTRLSIILRKLYTGASYQISINLATWV